MYSTAPIGPHVKTLRERIGMNTAQLGEVAGVRPERVEAIEAGTESPTLDELDKLIVATGSRLVTAVSPNLRTGEDAKVAEVLYLAVSKLLEVTTPQEPLPELGVTTWRWAPLGLMLVARKSVRSLLSLEYLGQGQHVAPGIARSVFEDVATAYWIADEPADREGRNVWIMQDFHEYLGLLAEDDDEWTPYVEAAHKFWREHGGTDDDFAKSLPTLRKRLVGPIKDWYVRYRAFSLEAHPTWRRIRQAFTESGTAAKTNVPTDLKDLAFAATMVAMLALMLENDWGPGGVRTGLGFRGDQAEFIELVKVLNAYTRGEPVKLDEPIYTPGPDDVRKPEKGKKRRRPAAR